jgi:hypothetical protein
MFEKRPGRMSTLRICMLAESFLPLQGGPELHAYHLAEALIDCGARLFVLTPRIDPNSPTRESIGQL